MAPTPTPKSATPPNTRTVWVALPAGDHNESTPTTNAVAPIALTAATTLITETCPLILDDPIATSDTTRRQAVLDTLLALSEPTQVILFTHDRDTRDWARQRLTEPTGALRELDRAGIPA